MVTALAESLDIPDYLYEDAKVKYEDVGDWLSSEDSPLRGFTPEIYPQGSFRYGTVVRPITENDEYDVDLVCRLTIPKDKTTQREVKALVGERLRSHKDYAGILKPSRRCWTLSFPRYFHIDVLPAIPNEETPPTGILLTDRELLRWQASNPIRFSEWFFDRMRVVFNERRAALAESMKANVEEIPDWQVRTPLQRTIQLLKRHRDVYFANESEHKPASIILTTLAASSYDNQRDVFGTLVSILNRMAQHIENRNGRWWIQNPVDEHENFADKWNEKPEKKDAFFAWLKKAQNDFYGTMKAGRLVEAVSSLSPVVGRAVITQVAQSLGLQSPSGLPAVTTALRPSVPVLADTSHCQPPPWREEARYWATVTGSIRGKRYSTKKLWDLTDRPAPKGIWLRFEVKTNTPSPYLVKWQIVNTGREASDQDGLRGDYYDSDKSTNVRWETTQYAGTHWVEAFIIKDGINVARSGRKYVKIRGA